MSKDVRFNLLLKNLAKESDNFSEANRSLSYAIWYAEKEFHVGMIGESFPLMKLWNLYSEDNIRRYNSSMKGETSQKTTWR